MTEINPNRRPFPHASWAWPAKGLDLLLMAVLAADEAVGIAHARKWFNAYDIDEAQFSEHRLLMAIAARYGSALADLPEYPRLLGLRRLLWTKARSAISVALPPLRTIAENGRPIMLMKGAARIAISPSEQTLRVSHDTDILLAPTDFATGLDTLIKHGWTPSTGESALCLATRGPLKPSINFFFGHFGDIDLHRSGYGLQPAVDVLEKELWERAEQRTFYGLPVYVPSPEDRVAQSLHNSALESHTHSDWIVDIVRTLQEAKLDARRFAALVETLGIGLQTEVVLSYLAQRIGLTVQPGLLDAARATRIGPVARVSTLLQMKPRSEWTPAMEKLRGLAKAARTERQRRAALRSHPETEIRGRWSSVRTSEIASEIPAMFAAVSGDTFDGEAKSARCVFELAVKLDGTRRRLEFELNSSTRHLVRLRVRDIWGRKGWHRLTFSGTIPSIERLHGLQIEARPGRALRGLDESEIRKYAAVPFLLLSHRIGR